MTGFGAASGFPRRKNGPRACPAPRHGAVTSLSTTVGALTFTIPLAAGYFGSLSLASPLANLLCLPLVALAFPLGLLAALLALFSPALGAAAGMAAALPVRLLLLLTRGFAALPFAGLTLESGYLRARLAFAYALWVLFFLTLRGRRPGPAVLLRHVSVLRAGAHPRGLQPGAAYPDRAQCGTGTERGAPSRGADGGGGLRRQRPAERRGPVCRLSGHLLGAAVWICWCLPISMPIMQTACWSCLHV